MVREELGELVNHFFLQDFVEGLVLGYFSNFVRYKELVPDDPSQLEEVVTANLFRQDIINKLQGYKHPATRTTMRTFREYEEFREEIFLELIKLRDERAQVQAISHLLYDLKEKHITSGDLEVDYSNFHKVLRTVMDGNGELYNWQTTVDIKKLHDGVENIRSKVGSMLNEPNLEESLGAELYNLEDELVSLTREIAIHKFFKKEYKGPISLSTVLVQMFKGEVPESLRGALGDQEPVVEEPDEVRQIVPQYSKKLERAYRRVAFRGEDKSQIRIATQRTLGKIREMQSQGMDTYSVNEVVDMINTIGSIADRKKTVVAPVCYGMESFIVQFDPNEALSVDVIDKIEYHGVPAFREKMGIWFDLVRSNFRSRYVANAELS